ncbi:transcriptional regulator [Frankia sp. EI5c]|nr:transcriptional regulator [Frankia sp. EI5c]
MSPAASAGTAPRDRSRRRARGESAGRTQILDATIACILEFGFYRASTNEIARRANVSWGAIQYHFGSREQLMLAAVKELNGRFLDSIAGRHVEGATLASRVDALYALLARDYGDQAFLARLQILLNLQHDPDTSPEVAAALAEHTARAATEINRLIDETVGPDAHPAGRNALFHGIRGFAFSQLLAEQVIPGGADHPEETRRAYLAGIVAAVRASETATRRASA